MTGAFNTTIYHFKTDNSYTPSEKGDPPKKSNVGRGYIEYATTHGVPQVYRAPGVTKQAVWAVFTLLALMGLGYNLAVLILQYRDYPVLTKVTLHQNKSLPFPAVTICNTNPIKSSKAVQEPRIMALLDSWGVAVSGGLVRSKRQTKQAETPELSKSRAKRSYSDPFFVLLYNDTEGKAAKCDPHTSVTFNGQASDCLDKATQLIQSGQDLYTVVNIWSLGGTCYLRACDLPLIDSNLELSTEGGGRHIYIRAYNECVSSPCVRGECVDTPQYYTCVCPEGFTDTQCQTEIEYYEEAGSECEGEELIPQTNTPSLEACQLLCRSTLACVAVQYTPSTGICHIRGECAKITVNQGSSVYIRKEPSYGYSLYWDVDCRANDLGLPATVPTPLECSKECDSFTSCVGFVYTQGECHLKSKCDTNQTEQSLGAQTYIKTGSAPACSLPRARITCPKSYPGINASACQALHADCCYDDSQLNVAWCFLDTLTALHHTHIHIAFRVARDSPDAPQLYSLWTGNSFTPDLQTEVTTDSFSRSDSHKHVYKSPIVECAWPRVIQASVMLYTSGEKKMFFDFDVDGQNKVTWYSANQLSQSSYSDAGPSMIHNYFSIQGHTDDRIRRRWFINHEYGGCDNDNGWWLLLDTDHRHNCDWEEFSQLPVFLYSAQNWQTSTKSFAQAETFFTRLRLDDSNMGGPCVSSCVHMLDGLYRSCLGCNVYIQCAGQVLTYHACHTSLVFDEASEVCVEASCQGGLALDQCRPNECQHVTCHHLGTCVMESDGWRCACVDGFSGRWCETCGTGSMSQYQLYCEGCHDNTVAVTTVGSRAACGDVCDLTIGCAGFKFTSTGQCEMKSRCENSSQSTNNSESVVYVKPEPSLHYTLFLYSVCTHPSDQHVTAASTPLACSWLCNLLDSACQGFEFEPPYRCTLKHNCTESTLLPANVSHAYIKMDTVPDVHLHTLLRAASQSGEDLLSLWSVPSTTTVNTPLLPEYLSTQGTDHYTYLSPLVHCVWNKILKVQLTLHTSGQESLSLTFSTAASSYLDWYTVHRLELTSYLDLLPETTTHDLFSLFRTWHTGHQAPDCTNVSGWMLVQTQNQSSSCEWEDSTKAPRFLYCPHQRACNLSDSLLADTFILQAELDTSHFTGGCVSDCLSLSDGKYQSCLGCNVYVECTSGVLEYHTCINNGVFDSSTGQCDAVSGTCSGDLMSSPGCAPDGCHVNPCYNGGTCHSTLYSFYCECPPRYTGEYCESCVGSEQLLLTWAVNQYGILYSDGTLLDSTSIPGVALSTRVPCGTNMLAFELSRGGGDVFGLVGSLSSGWHTGQGGIVCVDSVSGTDWTKLGFNDTDWPAVSMVSSSHDLSTVNPEATWVWGENTAASTVYCRYSPCSNPDILHISCDEEVTVYADGEEILTMASYSSASSVNIPCGTQILAFKAVNQLGYQGLKMAYEFEDWATGAGILVCTTEAVDTGQWQLTGYDDKTWEFPVIQTGGQYGDFGPEKFRPDSVEWVWSSNGVSPMYCRQHRCEGQYILNGMGDEGTVVYADGRELIQTSGAPFERRIPCSTHVVAFQITNTEGVGLFIASYNNDWATGQNTGNLTTVCTTDLNITEEGDRWTDAGYNDSDWSIPFTIPPDGDDFVIPDKVSSDAGFVWMRPDASWVGQQEVMYCRQVISISDQQTTVQEDLTTQELTTQELTTAPPPTLPPTTPVSLPDTSPDAVPGDLSDFLLEDIHNPPLNHSAEGLRDDYRNLDQLFKILAESSDVEKRDLGYAMTDLIVECDYMNYECTEQDFQWFFDAVHGNCYVFNSDWNHNNITKMQATEVGRRHGLRLTLDIGQYEYIPKIGEAAGVVVVVHPPDQMSFPEDEGVVVLPGQRTGIAIRTFEIQRLPLPYGDLDCFDQNVQNFSKNVFEELYSLKYGLNACYKTCYQRHIVESCHCGDPQYPITGQAFGSNNRACDVNDKEQDACKRRVAGLFADNQLTCDCELPCHEFKYKYTVSKLSWPSEKYEVTLMDFMRSKYALFSTYDISEFRRNLVGLEVYYEQFSYESLQEVPAYQLARLLTDFAGVLGLWLGCSLFSLAELVELGLDLILLYCYRLSGRPYYGRWWHWPSMCCRRKKSVDKASEGRGDAEDVTLTSLASAPTTPITPLTPTDIDFQERFHFPAPLQKGKPRKAKRRNQVSPNKKDLCGDCDKNYWRNAVLKGTG